MPYWTAFGVLSRRRPLAVGLDVLPLPIPLSELVALLAIRGVDDLEERERYLLLIDALDAEYLKIIDEKRAK